MIIATGVICLTWLLLTRVISYLTHRPSPNFQQGTVVFATLRMYKYEVSL